MIAREYTFMRMKERTFQKALLCFAEAVAMDRLLALRCGFWLGFRYQTHLQQKQAQIADTCKAGLEDIRTSDRSPRAAETGGAWHRIAVNEARPPVVHRIAATGSARRVEPSPGRMSGPVFRSE